MLDEGDRIAAAPQPRQFQMFFLMLTLKRSRPPQLARMRHVFSDRDAFEMRPIAQRRAGAIGFMRLAYLVS